ncbi:MAG: exopolysaccharide biosynthesis protein [Roseibium sp.]|nr:exopolysaccharide biosynthesis protein [Roseibium sp.]
MSGKRTPRKDRSPLGSLLRATGNRAPGALLCRPARIMIFPDGAIADLPVVLSDHLILVAGRIAVEKTSPWAPRFITKRKIPKAKVISTIDRLRPFPLQAS